MLLLYNSFNFLVSTFMFYHIWNSLLRVFKEGSGTYFGLQCSHKKL